MKLWVSVVMIESLPSCYTERYGHYSRKNGCRGCCPRKNRGKGVITSYSIHYTKLYEIDHGAPAGTAGAATPGTSSVQDAKIPDMPASVPGNACSVLLETPDLLFILKGAGIPVHGKGSLDSLIPQSKAARESLSFRSGPLHRLDRGTSGLIVFSKTSYNFV